VHRAPLAFAFALALALVAGCAWFGGGENTPVGSSAHDLVSPRAHGTLVVEIDHPPGSEPNAAAVSTLRSTLQEVTGRDAAHVKIVQDASIPSEPDKRYSFSEIETLEKAHRDHHTSGDEAALYVVYVAGSSTEDTSEGKVLGAAYRGTSIVIFKANVRSSSGGALSGKPPEDAVERAVLVHEFGHAAGLVNLGTRMVTPHEDAGHKGHSSDDQSVMYWAVENSLGLGQLCQLVKLGDCGVPYEFDGNDKADLAALRET
jgi:hypothetical protein